jgi:hypothetical protein
MKTVPFSDILAEVCQLIGLDRATLNEKSFGAIRDFTSRRIGTIWDREEWPDTNRFIKTFPGNPVYAVQFIPLPTLTTEGNIDLVTENLVDLWVQTDENVQELQLFLDQDFPRVYTADFSGDAYRLGTIAESEIELQNPFYYTYNGEKKSVGDIKTMSRYTSQVDGIGQYIVDVFIKLPYGSTVDFPSVYEGANGKLTTTITFDKNPNRIVQLSTNSVQGLAAWQVDPRTTTRAVPLDFMVEDIYNSAENEVTYLRFLQNGEKFVQYRLNAPRLIGIGYVYEQTYSSKAQVYYDPVQQSSSYGSFDKTKGSRGDFWNCLIDGTVFFTPVFPSQYWQQVFIPHRFKDYLVNGVSADFLKSEGRTEESVVFDTLAEMAVQQQIDVLIRQQGQNQKLNMAYTY